MAATVSTTISSPTGWQPCIKNVSLEAREQTLQRKSLHVVSLVAGFRYKTREIRSKSKPHINPKRQRQGSSPLAAACKSFSRLFRYVLSAAQIRSLGASSETCNKKVYELMK